jgi:hypothetical protein
MKITAITLILTLSLSAFAAEIQKTPKLGKVSMDEMKSTICPIDSSAQGYYLFEKGSTDFVYRNTTIREGDTGSDKGFQLVFKNHTRIKILNKAASYLGDFEIPLYNSGQNKEKITAIKGITHNLENGKIVETKLDTKQIIYEEKTDHITIVKIAMPEVKAGSVIELEYEILSDFLFNLQEWYFQRDVPVLYSEYLVGIPEYFHYKPSVYGYYPVYNSINTLPKTIRFIHTYRTEGYVTQSKQNEYEERYQEKRTTFYANDVPAFRKERFLKAAKNYLTRMTFELEGTQFPRSAYESYSNSWKDVSKELLEHDRFGRALNRDNFIDQEAQLIKAASANEMEMISKAFLHIQSKIKWNGRTSLLATKNLKQAWEEGQGNSADINLALISLLKAMEIKAFPVVLSTQSNGMLPLSHPSLTDLNYVIAMAEVEDQTYLMDATDPLSSINMLPVRCLNDKGHIIDPMKSGEINLTTPNSFTTYTQASLKLKADGIFEGLARQEDSGYAGMLKRKQFVAEDDSLSVIEKLEKEFPGIKIKSQSFTNLNTTQESLIDSFEITMNGQTDLIGDMLTFSPLVVFRTEDNPLKLENREYPIEFSYPSRELIMCSIEIPDGYEIESMPDPIRLAMEDMGMQLTFSVAQNGNVLQAFSDFRINRLLFLPAEYESVKSTFAFLLNKHSEKVVLKKTN